VFSLSLSLSPLLNQAKGEVGIELKKRVIEDNIREFSSWSSSISHKRVKVQL
jgi:hypothetical protein